MPLTSYGKNAARNAITGAALYAAAFTTAASGDTPGTEVSGGSPAYARKAVTWTNGAAGAASASVVWDIPASTTVASVGLFDAATAGNFVGWVDNADVTVSGQNTVTANWTYTQS
jgi:hypothetical protein